MLKIIQIKKLIQKFSPYLIKVYTVLTSVFAPYLIFYLLYRSIYSRQYLQFWSERFGYKLHNNSIKPIIWLHAVSVGEIMASQTLVTLLVQQYPHYDLLITVMSVTGRQMAINLHQNHNIMIHYLPYDVSWSIKKFYQVFCPKIGIIMETEIWPHLLYYGKHYQVPIILVNARLSYSSMQKYLCLLWFMRSSFNSFSFIACQDSNSLKAFKKLGYQGSLECLNSTKFDIILPDNFAATYLIFFKMLKLNKRKIITFSSTRNGEEELFIKYIINSMPEHLYLIIPRHPERFTAVAAMLNKYNIKYQLRSTNAIIQPDIQVILGDSMGEMLAYYSFSYLVIIGGSFNSYGGQNLLEALYMHKPVIFGDSMYNFSWIAEQALQYNCAIQTNIIQLPKIISQACTDRYLYDSLQQQASTFIAKFCGASQQLIDIIEREFCLNS